MTRRPGTRFAHDHHDRLDRAGRRRQRTMTGGVHEDLRDHRHHGATPSSPAPRDSRDGPAATRARRGPRGAAPRRWPFARRPATQHAGCHRPRRARPSLVRSRRARRAREPALHLTDRRDEPRDDVRRGLDERGERCAADLELALGMGRARQASGGRAAGPRGGHTSTTRAPNRSLHGVPRRRRAGATRLVLGAATSSRRRAASRRRTHAATLHRPAGASAIGAREDVVVSRERVAAAFVERGAGLRGLEPDREIEARRHGVLVRAANDGKHDRVGRRVTAEEAKRDARGPRRARRRRRAAARARAARDA